MPLPDVEGKAGTAPPAQTVKLVPKPNVGVTFGLTVKVNAVDVAHCPAPGINV